MSRASAIASGALAFEVILALSVSVAVLSSPRIDAELTPGDERCPWQISQPEGACIRSLAGVEPGRHSLVREPGYLETVGELRAWFSDQQKIYDTIAGRGAVELVIEEPGAPPRTLLLPLVPPSWLRIISAAAPILLATIALLMIGTVVFLRKPDEPAAWSLLALCHGCAWCWFPSLVNAGRGIALQPALSRAFYVVNLAGLALVAVAVLRLASTFPEPRFGKWTRLLSFYLPALLGLTLFVFDVAGVQHQSVVLLLVLSFGASMVIMAWSQVRARGQIQRLRARWMLWGLAVPMATFVALRVPVLLFPGVQTDPSDTILILSSIAAPLGIAIAVLRDKLFDIEVYFRRTILGAVVTSVVLFAYYLGISTFAETIAPGAYSSFGGAFLIAVVLTFVLLPAQSRLEALLDRMFFKNQHHYRQLLSRVPDDLAQIRSSEEAIRHVLHSTGDAIGLERVAIALDREATAALYVRGEVGPPSGALFWEQVRGLGRWALRESLPKEAGDVERWMSAANLDLVFPLRTADAFIGLFACSALPGDRLLSTRDVELLSAVAGSLALALSQSLAYETIRRMNAELEATVHKRTAELEAARVQLYQRDKMVSLGVLAAGVAHELNTPLGVIMSVSDQLAASMAPGASGSATAPAGGAANRTAKLLALCHDAAARASRIVKDLTAFSRPEQPSPELADLRREIDATLTLLGPMFAEKSITVRVETGELPKVFCYPALINQVVLNLILNAAAAMEGGGAITIAAGLAGDGKIQLSVHDSGPGIPDEIRDRLFEPFFTTKPVGQGTGLGLSLCFSIAQLHGGKIWEDRPPQGAKFILEIPLEVTTASHTH